MFPADAVTMKDARSDKNIVYGPVIQVIGHKTLFLKPVHVELTYSHSDVENIDEDFLPVGKKVQFTTKYGLLRRFEDSVTSKTKEFNLNERDQVCFIERPRKDQLKFLFSVEHFSK